MLWSGSNTAYDVSKEVRISDNGPSENKAKFTPQKITVMLGLLPF